MSDPFNILFWVILAMLAYSLVTSIFSVLGARVHFEIKRHDLLVRSQQMRMEYLNTIDEKMAGVLDEDEMDVIIEEDEPTADAA